MAAAMDRNKASAIEENEGDPESAVFLSSIGGTFAADGGRHVMA
jgi:hypothetical protein